MQILQIPKRVLLVDANPGDLLQDSNGRFWIRRKGGADYLKDGFSPPVDWPTSKLEHIGGFRGPFWMASQEEADAIRKHLSAKAAP